MSPLRGEEFTGRTAEEAIERGLRALGRKRADVDIEVLEKGKPANGRSSSIVSSRFAKVRVAFRNSGSTSR